MGTGPGNYSRLLVARATSQFIASGATLNVNLLNITGPRHTPLCTEIRRHIYDHHGGRGIVGKFATFDQPAGLASGTRLTFFTIILGMTASICGSCRLSYATALEGSGINSNARSVAGALDRVMATDQAGAATAAQNALSYEISGLTMAQFQGAHDGTGG